MPETPVSLIHPVPYYAQWESPDLVPDIIAGTLSAADDPLWQKSGAASPEEYAFWSWRLCGMACLRMALDHWRGSAPPAVTLPRPPHRGGHLVLAVGATADHLLVHNPSGFPDGSQRFAEVPWGDLGRFYAGRGVLLGPGGPRS